jgi:hypothetical protein
MQQLHIPGTNLHGLPSIRPPASNPTGRSVKCIFLAAAAIFALTVFSSVQIWAACPKGTRYSDVCCQCVHPCNTLRRLPLPSHFRKACITYMPVVVIHNVRFLVVDRACLDSRDLPPTPFPSTSSSTSRGTAESASLPPTTPHDELVALPELTDLWSLDIWLLRR